MNTVILVNIFAIMLAYIAKYPRCQTALIYSFLLIVIFLAIRYDFGNDYMSYKEIFDDIHCTRMRSVREIGDSYFEPGWIILNKCFGSFYLLIAFIAVLTGFIYCSFIRKYVCRSYWWFAVFLYTFNTNMMLMQASAMRQALAILIFIYSIRYLISRNLLLYLFCCGLAATFHMSALILIPVYWLSAFSLRTKKSKYLLVFLFVMIYVGSRYLIPLVSDLSLSTFSRYQSYLAAEAMNVGVINAFVYTCMLITILVYAKNDEDISTRILRNLSIIALFTFPISSVVQMLARLGYYFFPATLAVYTYTAKQMAHSIRFLFFLLIAVVIIIRFITILTSDTWRDQFMVYKTVFDL